MKPHLLFLVFLLLPPSLSLQLTFTPPSCKTFRTLLISHSDIAIHHRKTSEKLSIAAISLFYIPILPYPLAFSSIALSARADTSAQTALRDMGVTDSNWEIVNAKCAGLLMEEVLTGMTFKGERWGSYAISGLAIVFATIVHIALFAFCCIECKVFESKETCDC